MANPQFEPDPAAHELAPDGELAHTAVTFRGWLSAKEDGEPLDGGIYRLYTSPWFDEWLEIESGDLLYRLQGDESSTIWVKRDARINKCQAAEACHFGEQEVELGTDPTSTYSAAWRRYPRG